MRTPEFVEAVDGVLALAVLARGFDVHHLRHDGRVWEHRITDAARLRSDGLLVYDT